MLVTQNDLLLKDDINIASTIINMDIKTIQSNENYNIQDFSNDLKHVSLQYFGNIKCNIYAFNKFFFLILGNANMYN